MPAHKKKPKNKNKPKKNVGPKPQPGPQPGPRPAPVQPKPQPTPAPATPAPAPAGPRDLADPGLTLDATTKQPAPYGYQKNTRGAQLFGPNGIQALDVKQGAIGDCYLAAAMSSIAAVKPDAIRNAIKDNGDGTYTVRFYEVGWDGKKSTHMETVDADLPHYGSAPAYAKSAEVVDGKQHMELWPSIIEKAYAAWKGSYEAIGNGGISGDVMTALTGEANRYQQTNGYGNNDALWTKMKAASDAKRPMTAGSGGKDDARYQDPKAGVYGWHAYSILGVEEVPNGDKSDRFVICRNPWGVRRRSSDAAAVGDTTNSTAGGVFKLTWDEFRRLFDNVTIG